MFQYCSCFLFWVFGNEACGILAFWPGIKPTPSALEGEILATGPPGKSPLASFKMYLVSIYTCLWGFPGGSEVKASASDAGDLGLIPGSGRSPGEGNGNPLQYSCLENPMDRGPWWATVHGVAKSWTRLSDFTSLMLSLSFPACAHPCLSHTELCKSGDLCL